MTKTVCTWKSATHIVSLMVFLVLVGCQNPTAPSVQQLMADLQQQGINFKPVPPGFIMNSALFPLDLHPILALSYERRSTDGVDYLLLHLTQSVTQTQQLESDLQDYATDEYGLRGLNLGGPVRYYDCGDMMVIYQGGGWNTGIDPAVDKAVEEHCALAFIRYPPE